MRTNNETPVLAGIAGKKCGIIYLTTTIYSFIIASLGQIMTNVLFTQPQFTNDEASRDFLEGIIWPNGAVCPHCGGTERNTRSQAASHRPGVWHCGDCRSQFTVTVGTVFERSKVPLHKWVLANHLMCSSKKGMSALQLQRTIGVTYKTAWFMFHRLREAMAGNDTGMMGVI